MLRRNVPSREGICGLTKASTFVVGGYGGNVSDYGPLDFVPDLFSDITTETWLEASLPPHVHRCTQRMS